MSVIETPAVHHRSGGATDHHRHPSKRKFDDEDDEDLSDLVCVRMRKDEAKAVNSWSASSGAAVQRSHIQFFVRMMSGGNTIVMQAFPEDSVKSIHERIQSMKGIPVFEQRLIYRGKQLQCEQTLAECSIQNDANLQLVGRMRSTEHPQAWQVINDMVSLVYRLCRGEMVHDALKTIKGLITSYLNMTPRIDNDSASGYFQIFLSSSAPAVLVMLYVSPYAGNKDCADSSVRHFLSSCRTTLSKALHGQCARVVLEFCKLLRRVGCDDPLYLYCRSTCGSLLETAGVSYAGSENVKGLVLIQDIFPFVCELASSLLRDLDLSMESPTAAGHLSNDVGDFTAFLIPLRTGIKEQQSLKDSMAQDKRHKDILLADEIEYLHRLYIELLDKIDQCLQRMDQSLAGQEMMEGDNLYPAWSHYLSILKELYQISKLYDGAEEKLWSVLTRQRSVLCMLIVRYAKRTDEHQWILEHRCVTNFESRRHLAMMMFPEVKEDYEELHEMLIDRSQLLAESFEYIARAEPESLHAGLFMEFKNEEATGPGVLREWFLLVCQAIFNPQNALFVACPNDRRRFFPNPASKVHPLHLEYFSFAGRVIALALMHRVQVGIVFDRVFFLQLAGNYITLEDIRDADPRLHTSCKQILDMDADFIDSDALGLTFVREVEELGHRNVVELCPGGKNLVVDSKNRDKYVDLLIQDRFVTSISEQVSHFAKGFTDILSNSKLQQYFFQSLDLEDLDWMLHGSEDTISVEDWKAHTEYNGYKETDIQISWFWEIVGRMTADQRKVLLFFWTSVKYLPVEGFRGLASRLYIYRSLEPGDRLPSSHTCFFRLCFPAYSSLAVMQDRLQVITQEHIGCSFGTW
ncbi:E3 ubiquitin-protein ligase UPL5 [Spatholobus suberectus]|nr:E3 ubiquitin-protein ligase UPL5 [Spatholobus suberectus]